jgi:hypothetical protein
MHRMKAKISKFSKHIKTGLHLRPGFFVALSKCIVQMHNFFERYLTNVYMFQKYLKRNFTGDFKTNLL